MDKETNETNDEGAHASEGFGFFTRVTDAQLFERIETNVATRKYFTGRVASERVSVRLSDIALIVSPTLSLAFVSHVRPTRAGTTGTRGFKASGPLRTDVSLDELTSTADDEYTEEIKRGFREPSFRPSLATWKAVWLAIKRLRPNLADQLRRIEQLRFDEAFDFDENSDDEQVFYEKDAVGVALDVAGITFGGVFAEISEGRQNNKALIEALCGSPTEDVVIDHDVHNFPEYTPQADRLHACEFVQHRRRLTIFNVNRRPGERALGVDLIYHNVTYDAFTFIQYKMLEREGSVQVPAWRYRLDGQFDDELGRMRSARSTLHTSIAESPDHFRFGKDPFFIKLCRRQHLKVNSGQLVSGAYVNLTHCDLILDAIQHGAARVLEPGNNVGRWLNRTQFTDLVARGWIGTNNITLDALANYVNAALDLHKSVLIARGETPRAGGDGEDGENFE